MQHDCFLEKVSTFFLKSSHVAYPTKGNGLYILCPYILEPWGRVKWLKLFFLKVVMLHIKFKETSIDQHASKAFDLKHTPDLLGHVERSDIEVVQISEFFMQLR